MQITATQKHIRISPRKMRIVADVVIGLTPQDAIKKLSYVNKRSAKVLEKVIRQALANAVNNLNISADRLQNTNIQIGDGATFKRFRPVSRGRAHSILKRTSNIKVTIETAPIPAPLPTPTPTTTKPETKSTKPKTTKTPKKTTTKQSKPKK